MYIVVDANVLIDYANSDLSILTLAAKHIAPIYVPSVVLDEVEQLSEANCERLGLVVIEEPVDILLSAGEKRGALSFPDHVCLLLAIENRWTCLSNDKPLHKACGNEGVAVIWGLRLMVDLVDANQLDKIIAIKIADTIRINNPKHITEEIIDEFKEKLK